MLFIKILKCWDWVDHVDKEKSCEIDLDFLLNSKYIPSFKLALKFVFATDLSDFRPELTFKLDFNLRFFTNQISSGHQVY